MISASFIIFILKYIRGRREIHQKGLKTPRSKLLREVCTSLDHFSTPPGHRASFCNTSRPDRRLGSSLKGATPPVLGPAPQNPLNPPALHHPLRPASVAQPRVPTSSDRGQWSRTGSPDPSGAFSHRGNLIFVVVASPSFRAASKSPPPRLETNQQT